MQHNQLDTTVARRLALGAAVAALCGAAACSGGGSTGLGAGANQIGFVATSTSSANAALAPTTVSGHTLDLTSVALTVARAELKRAPSDACPGDNDDDEHQNSSTASTASCGELKIGPTTVNLPLTGSVVSLPANTIPPGTYRELQLRVSQVELKGTFDGKAFDVMLPVDVKSEIQFSTPLVVAADTATSITISVPVSTWLTNPDGTLIDPSTILASPTLTAQVKERIRASFHAFEDRDHDGHDDHGGHD